MRLIIDAYTKNTPGIVRALKKLKTTNVIYSSRYMFCPECTAIYIDTTLTEEQMDEVLYRRKDTHGYIGVVSAD